MLLLGIDTTYVALEWIVEFIPRKQQQDLIVRVKKYQKQEVNNQRTEAETKEQQAKIKENSKLPVVARQWRRK